MGNNPVTAAQYTTTHAFFAKERLPRPKFTPEGELSYFYDGDPATMLIVMSGLQIC